MKSTSDKRSYKQTLVYKIAIETEIKELSTYRRHALGYQVKAVELAEILQSLQCQELLTPQKELNICRDIASFLEQAAQYFDSDPSCSCEALVCRANAIAVKNGDWQLLQNVYLENFEQIRQLVIIAPILAMHNHPMLWLGFVALISEESITSSSKIHHPQQLNRLNSRLYPNSPASMMSTKFLGASVVKATTIHHPPYFIPDYLPGKSSSISASVGYLLNTYTAQSLCHTLCAIEPLWDTEQINEIRQVFNDANANQMQTALISLHDMTHFLGSLPLNHPHKKTATLMRWSDEELRADSGSNVGFDCLKNELFDQESVKAVILMDILDRIFKYTLATPINNWEKLLLSHYDVAAGQMRLNALRQHGALKQIHKNGRKVYYLDYERCIQSDRKILDELEKINKLGLDDTNAYNIERIKFLKQYIGTSEEEGWKLDSLYYEVRNASPWLSAQLAFEYTIREQIMMFETLAA